MSPSGNDVEAGPCTCQQHFPKLIEDGSLAESSHCGNLGPQRRNSSRPGAPAIHRTEKPRKGRCQPGPGSLGLHGNVQALSSTQHPGHRLLEDVCCTLNPKASDQCLTPSLAQCRPRRRSLGPKSPRAQAETDLCSLPWKSCAGTAVTKTAPPCGAQLWWQSQALGSRPLLCL